MSKIQLRVRDLRSGDERAEPFASVEAARAWLVARPPFVEALGVASAVDAETSRALKVAMRPLDAAEIQLQQQVEAAGEEARARREREGHAAQLAAAEAHRSALRDADPNRPMQIRWRFDQGMNVAEQHDERAITDAARAAVLAWIAERNEWVEERGQVVGEGLVTVWPNAVPADGERVLHGTFTPVSAPSDGPKAKN